MCLSGVRTSTRLQENTTTTTNTITIATFSNTVERSAAIYLPSLRSFIPYKFTRSHALHPASLSLSFSLPRLHLAFPTASVRSDKCSTLTHTHRHTHTIYACACAFVCVCVYTRVRSWPRAANTLRSPRLRGRASGGAHQLPSYNKRRKKRGKNLLSLRQVYTARSVPRPAAVGSCALYRYLFVPFIPASSLSLFPRFSLGCPFPFCPVAPRSFLLPPPAPRLLVLLLDHRRCCQTTCTPRPGQLPSCGHPFPSFSLSPSWVNPPPSAIPSHFNKLFFLLSSRRYLSLPSLPPRRPPFSPFAHPPRGCPSLFFFFSRSLPTSLVLLLFPRLSYLPLPARNDATLYQFPRR